jgi:hypothetical protein
LEFNLGEGGGITTGDFIGFKGGADGSLCSGKTRWALNAIDTSGADGSRFSLGSHDTSPFRPNENAIVLFYEEIHFLVQSIEPTVSIAKFGEFHLGQFKKIL